MVSRRRNYSEAEAAPAQQQPAETKKKSKDAKEEVGKEEPGLLHRLRNCWEFANLMQYISMFGKVMKIDEDFGIEDLENECLKPTPSEKLLEIGLCLLKWISSHRGLTLDNFDEYTRRQYTAKAPHLPNPFGEDEVPNRFNDFDIFLRLRVLHQLTVWTFWNADRIREKLPEQREIDQTAWRVEELGYDSEDRYYYVLDDNRLYRLTFPPPPPPPKPKPKSNSRAARAMRASKRRRVSGMDNDDGEVEAGANGEKDPTGSMTWECVAVSLSDYRQFLETIEKTRDPNEEILRDRLLEEVMPIIEKEEESQQRQIAKREKELFNMELLAGAKRSSRIAGKAERERQEREAQEAAERHRAELAASRKEAARQKVLEQKRQERIMGREERTKERERKRREHEAELERISEEQKKLERGEGRISERHLKAELEKRRKNLESLSQEDQWIFDCSGCGVHGENLDDGSHSVACEKCNVWQHSKCLGISQDEAERDDFVFVCRDCKRREEEAKMPKLPTLKFRVGDSPSSAGALQQQQMPQQQQFSFSPTKPVGPVLQHGSPSKPPSLPPFAPNAVQAMSPERRPQAAFHVFNSTPPRPPFSPSKGANGSTPSSKETIPKFMPGQHPLPLIQQSFPRRPSSSHSVQSASLPSPIQNRPSMSPTQGNRDVGPVIAGYPSNAAQPPPPHNGPTNVAPTTTATPWTPYGQHQAPRPDFASRGASSSFGAGPGQQSSFSSATPVHSSPLQSAHGVPFSGISPTKNSPRPISSSSGVTGAPILPPIQKLEPSPKLMGRSSPDAPIPAPMKSMTPDQEEQRRQREHLYMAQGLPPPYPSQGQGQMQGQNPHPSLMSSPSLNRIPPLGPSALSAQPAGPEQGQGQGQDQGQVHRQNGQ